MSGGMHPRIARAMSLLQPPSPFVAPDPTQTYRALLSPINSDYATAFGTFRKAFAELTLLTWEERLDSPDRALQKMRAREKGLEPFVWKRPDAGLPVGEMPGLGAFSIGVGMGPHMDMAGQTMGAESGSLGIVLPAINVPLAYDSGTLGSSMHREAAATQKQQAAAEKEKEAKKQVTLKINQQNSRNQPLFNGVQGRPQQDWKSRQNGKGGGVVVLGGEGRRWAKSGFFDFQR